MKRWLHHPLWAHGPAFALWVGFVVWFLSSTSGFARAVPLQIGLDGTPQTWGSPWAAFGLVAGLGLFFLALGILIDEQWAMQESRKRFNLLSLLDEVVLGLLITIQVVFLRLASEGADAYAVPIEWFMVGLGGPLVLGVLVEWLRPYRPSSAIPAVAAVGEGFRTKLYESLARGEALTYWDVQNPRYVSWLSIGVPVALWVAAGFLVATSVVAASVQALVGVLLLQFYGGQRTRVDREGLTIRYGLAGIRIFRCSRSQITGIRIRTFAPIADFGGYGIRMAKGVTAYYLAGRSGVQLELEGRRSVLIGSMHPERLAAVLEALTGIPVQEEVNS